MRPERLRLRQVTNDKNLLHIFLAAAVLVAISIILVPLNIENETDLSHQGVNKLKLNQAQDLNSFQADAASDARQRQFETTAKEKKAVSVPVLAPQQMQETDDATPISPKVPYHVVFSTGCSIFQDWQSYVFFYHALQSGQIGHVTRIASGCKDEDAEDLKAVFERDIAVMAPGRLHLHLTPDFSRVNPKVNFKYVSHVTSHQVIISIGSIVPQSGAKSMCPIASHSQNCLFSFSRCSLPHDSSISPTERGIGCKMHWDIQTNI
jgi:hypothetical protein